MSLYNEVKYTFEIVDSDIKTGGGRISNSLFAWTFGQLIKKGFWDSDKAINLEQLTEDVEHNLKINAKQLTLAIPLWVRDFDFIPKKRIEEFRIHVHTDINKPPFRSLVFNNMTILTVMTNKIPQSLFKDNNYSYQAVWVEVESGRRYL